MPWLTCVRLCNQQQVASSIEHRQMMTKPRITIIITSNQNFKRCKCAARRNAESDDSCSFCFVLCTKSTSTMNISDAFANVVCLFSEILATLVGSYFDCDIYIALGLCHRIATKARACQLCGNWTNLRQIPTRIPSNDFQIRISCYFFPVG